MATMSQPISPLNCKPIPAVIQHRNHIISAVESATSLTHLKQIHSQILKSGLDRSNSLLLKLIISSCSISSSLDYALSVFNHLHNPDPVLCNRFLRELSRTREPEKTLLVYQKMRREGLLGDRFSFPSLLKASAKIEGLIEGMELHGSGLKLGFGSDPYVQTALVGLYAACGKIQDARKVFDEMSDRDIVTWNTVIDGYCQSGLFEEVLLLLEEMKSYNVEPDERIFTRIISACGRSGNLELGKRIHGLVSENNRVLGYRLHSALIAMYAGCGLMDIAENLFGELSPKNLVASTAMVTGYSKSGQVEAARVIFNQMVEKDLVCWSAMISGYAGSDQPQEALKLFDEMCAKGIKPDRVTMLSVISACANLGALDQTEWIQKFVEEKGFNQALRVNNALIDMYANCGNLERAKRVFDQMPTKNVISWTSIMTAFAMHGDANNALNHFHQMKSANIQPNSVTFIGVLYACSHAGLVEEGKSIFSSMVEEYNIEPRQAHYGCMVDLYGRANLLKEALEVIENMPLPPNIVIWGSLMAACRVHNEFELGVYAAKKVLELDPDHDGAHILLSNIYAKERRFQNVGEVRKLMQNKGISKEKGCSRIELNSLIHEFMMADKNHKQVDEIYAKLDEVVGDLKRAGYDPNTNEVLIDTDEEEKKELVLWHSEKLALSYGLLMSKEKCIRIIKNLRICEDCHNFMKLASRVYEKEIVVRDRTRFHHYKNGECSCKDFW